MLLKTLVKVGRVTNLSDARYCAGMGVNFLGFNVCPGTTAFIEPKLYQDIRGWVTGPKMVAEFYDFKGEIDQIIKDYAPDYLEVTTQTYQLAASTQLPCILYLEATELDRVNEYPDAEYILIDEASAKLMEQLPSRKILVKLENKASLESLSLQFDGIALSGGDEIRPGFKNYDELADILEELDQ